MYSCFDSCLSFKHYNPIYSHMLDLHNVPRGPSYSSVALPRCCSVLSLWMRINGEALARMTMTITGVSHPPLCSSGPYCSVRRPLKTFNRSRVGVRSVSYVSFWWSCRFTCALRERRVLHHWPCLLGFLQWVAATQMGSIELTLDIMSCSGLVAVLKCFLFLLLLTKTGTCTQNKCKKTGITILPWLVSDYWPVTSNWWWLTEKINVYGEREKADQAILIMSKPKQ